MTIRNFSYTLDANEQVLVNRVGRMLRCTGGDNAFEVQPQTRSGDYSFDKFELLDGLGVILEKSFDQLVITNGGTAQEIEFYVSNQEVFDARTNLNISGTVTTQSPLDGRSHGQETVTTSATTIIAARVGDREAVIKNMGAVDVFIGTSSVTTSTGYKLEPGESLTLKSNLSWSGITASGSCDVCFVDEYKN